MVYNIHLLKIFVNIFFIIYFKFENLVINFPKESKPTMPSTKKNKLYALSTCVWCKKTKRLLDTLGVKYEVIYVDLLSGNEGEKAVAEVCRWNSEESYPVLVINNKKAICGYDEEKITREFA